MEAKVEKEIIKRAKAGDQTASISFSTLIGMHYFFF
jgi:hypothetical protein